MALFKDYDLDIMRLEKSIAQLSKDIESIRDYVTLRTKGMELSLNTMKDEIESIKKALNELKNVKQDKQLFTLNSRIEQLERMINTKTITKIELNTFRLSKAQELLLNFCAEPRTFKEMEKFMREHNYTMGMNFQKLRDMGLIRKENGKWVKVKEITGILR